MTCLALAHMTTNPQDKKVKGKIDARNQLETYVYNMKSTVEDKLKDKIEEEDKDKIKEALKEAQEWLEENPDAEADEYADKLKEVEEVCNPIISQVRGGGRGGQRGRADARACRWRAVRFTAMCIALLSCRCTRSQAARQAARAAPAATMTTTWAAMTSSDDPHPSAFCAFVLDSPGQRREPWRPPVRACICVGACHARAVGAGEHAASHHDPARAESKPPLTRTTGVGGLCGRSLSSG